VAAVLSGVATYVAAGHLLLGYAALGLVLGLRPELTGACDSPPRTAQRPRPVIPGGALRACAAGTQPSLGVSAMLTELMQ
jgi:hypothetical protein